MPDLHIPASAGSHQSAYLALPAVGDGPFPGVVVLQDAFGVGENIKDHADRLASAGYVAVAPAIYTARGGGPRCVAATLKAMNSGEGPVFDDIEAAREWLAGREDCTGKVGVIGFCQGGTFALLSAARHDYAAAAPNYGMVPEDTADLAGICPVVASFGGRDSMLRGHPERLEAALTGSGVDHDVKTYPEAGHSFFERFPANGLLVRFAGAGFHRPSAEDAWGRILRFFETHLKDAA
ncbi:carboxymethylenebutenolidase [Actinomycetospora succinea]|uniref:Carboxymethylenebutenolidase n=1 Tax=Actinomycetospora succinea TaxID=663603 RepID=A0A4R6VM72_9PSEU|nr:dienelactone hydrolase family protein [Actinomycetospora succinea]TDQ63041.1 carboxymethylenebutenolidase [Actinomycetospora succinea]